MTTRFFACVLCLALGCGDDDGAPLDAGRDAPDERVEDAGTDTAERDGSVERDEGLDAPDEGTPDMGAPPPPGTLYVTVGSEQRLAVLDVDADGTLRDADSIDVGGRAGALARRGSQFFVGVPGGVVTVETDGELRVLGRTDLPGQPVYLEVDGDHLVAAFFNDNLALSFSLEGSPPYAQVDRLDTEEEPHAARVHEGRLFIPHRNGQVLWAVPFRDGEFDEAQESEGAPGAGPRHIDFSPSGARAYVVNEYTDSVSVFDVADGALSRIGDPTTTLGEGVDGGDNTCADIHVHPSGEFLYASNRGDDSIAILDVEDDGLRFRETVPTEARPREFELSEFGHLLFSLGQDSGAVQSYRIEADGSLTPASRVELGNGLLWGIFVAD